MPYMTHSRLSYLLHNKGITRKMVAAELGISPYSVYKRISGKLPFTIPEAYKILHLLDKPDSMLPVLFPEKPTLFKED